MNDPKVECSTDADHPRVRLQRVLDDVSAGLSAIEAELAATRAVRANGGDDDEHDPDGIPLSSVLELLEGQKGRLLKESREADSALIGLAHGDYGSCRTCGRPIGVERLQIRPTTRTCVRCAA